MGSNITVVFAYLTGQITMDSLTFTIVEHKSGYFIVSASRFQLLHVFCSFSYNRQNSGRRVNISLLKFLEKTKRKKGKYVRIRNDKLDTFTFVQMSRCALRNYVKWRLHTLSSLIFLS